MRRRQLIAHGGAVCGAIVGLALTQCHASAQRPAFSDPTVFAGCRTQGDGYRLSAFSADGSVLFDTALPGRGHDVAFHPHTGHGVVFARRPGRFALVFDVTNARVKERFNAQTGRHFYGHGVFSNDGRHLFTTENNYDEGHGVIGIRDCYDGYRQIGECPSFGVGPHDIQLLSDQKTLVVANGGILTHPDREREKLNIDDMKPNLALIDSQSRLLVDRFELPNDLHKLSIRHLDVAANGDIAVAMQYEGGKRDLVPLVGVFEGAGIRLFNGSKKLSRKLRHYAGSVAFDVTGEKIAVTNPRADRVTIWDKSSGSLLDDVPFDDAGGVDQFDKGFVVAGTTVGTLPQGIKPLTLSHWDNHLKGRL